jgi:hypothetical protein
MTGVVPNCAKKIERRTIPFGLERKMRYTAAPATLIRNHSGFANNELRRP